MHPSPDSEIPSMARVFRSRSSTVHERFGEETVILNLETGSYYSVQATGNAIWELASGGATDAAILRHVRQSYAGSSDLIANATTAFLDQIVAEGLVDAEAAADAGEAAAGPVESAPDFAPPLLQKYTDMEEMLLLDPIHEVDEHGWPSARQQS